LSGGRTESPAARARARAAGLTLGTGTPGTLNAITDVGGVRVGHQTIFRDDESCARTGVTAILPHGGNLFREKVPAACHVINGFGKATGVSQVAELGTLETPIVLTNTFAVGDAYRALVRHAIRHDADVGGSAGSVNPVVLECNDGVLNDLRALHVDEEDVLSAIKSATGAAVEEGAVGAGTGMLAYQWKAGIGTSSRRVGIPDADCVVGVLVLANLGRRRDLVIRGVPVGRLLDASTEAPAHAPGSCIIVIATDAPLDARQLGRVARRAQYGLGRTGTFGEHGSGEYAVAFSTANLSAHTPAHPISSRLQLAEDGPALDRVFEATVEAVEEAVINALFVAPRVAGKDGNVGHALPVDPVLSLLG
jgi:D-aminopeptidase